MLQQQLRNNEPLTVTHPEVKRFFMTIREAVSLVLQASVIGEKGDTLVLDMGQPLLILEVVRSLIRLSARNEKQVPIRFSGLRPGEKLVEELFYENELVDDTSFAKIKRARGLLRDWNALAEKLDELDAALFLNGSDSIRAKLKEILPEFSYSPGNGSDAGDEQDSWLTARSRIA
jgi:FlaA1/EpsC-like NDP-sugar epimerase